MPSARKTIFVLSLAIVFSIGAYADTFNVQINDAGAFATDTPDGSVSQAFIHFNSANFVLIGPKPATWQAGGFQTGGIVNSDQLFGTETTTFDPINSNETDTYNYQIGFTQPGSNTIVGGLDVTYITTEGSLPQFWFYAFAGDISAPILQ